MTDTNNETSEQVNLEGDFAALFEQSIKEISEGEIIEGTVVHITDDAVIIDLGYKSEGSININQCKDREGNLTVAVGDTVKALIERLGRDAGYVRLSKTKADQLKIWDKILESHDSGKVLNGKVVEQVKGGYHVDLEGLTAFLPNSQVDLIPIKDPSSIIDKSFDYKVLKYNRRKNNVIISRRAILEEARAELKDETLKNIHEGALVEGIVKNIEGYGAFIDLGGIDGLVHLSDISWKKVTHPSQVLEIGDTITVKVLKYNEEEGKIYLGLKQTTKDPWEDVTSNYPVGSNVVGKVVNITDYGAFIELSDSLEGLVHISEMSWTKLKHPTQKVNIGDEVNVQVLDVDNEKKRISLGMKQTDENPWDKIKDEHPVGSTVTGTVKSITDFGVFVGINEFIDGLIHVADISWKKVDHPSQKFKKGDEVTAIVTNIDTAKQRFSLSTKELETNPWDNVEEKYMAGHIVDGTVTSIADFGVFVELESGLEGLVHISDLNAGSSVQASDLKTGTSVEVEVLNINPNDKKIGLSIRAINPVESVETKAEEETAPEETTTEETSGE